MSEYHEITFIFVDHCIRCKTDISRNSPKIYDSIVSITKTVDKSLCIVFNRKEVGSCSRKRPEVTVGPIVRSEPVVVDKRRLGFRLQCSKSKNSTVVSKEPWLKT